MRLSDFQVKQVCQKLLLSLRSKQLINLKKTEADILAKMHEIFLADLRVEDAINREAEKILDQYAVKMIKKQLIKDKNVVI
jgi:hypothetical protein